MDTEDARSLPAAAQEEKRKQAIRLRKQGLTYARVGALVGVHWATVHGWWKRYESGGAAALKSRTRGRKEGESRRLNPAQEWALQRLIRDKTPDQLKMPFALWTRHAVRRLITRQYRVVLPIRTIGHYLQRWGFTPQKPAKRAYERRPAEVTRWLAHEYPKIAARAKAEKAEIHWGDETGLRNDDQRGRGYAPRGKTPVIRLMAKRASINLISTVTNQGKVRFMVYEDTMTAQRLITFMQRLITDARRKVFLILDNLRVHHAKLVTACLAEHQGDIQVFYLPSYSPEMNPDEYLNGDLKVGVAAKVPARDKRQLKKAAVSHLRMLQQRPERVKKYFEHPAIRYAA